MENMNMFWAIALPAGAAIISVLGVLLIAIYHSHDMQKFRAEEERLEQMRQNKVKQEQAYLEAGQWIVNSVNSNNNSPRLGENLSALSSRLEQLGIKLNVKMNGCVENADR